MGKNNANIEEKTKDFKLLKLALGKELPYSSYNNCEWVSHKPEKIKINLRFATENGENVPCATVNMQEDCACFEGLVFSIWSVCEECLVELEFEPYLEWNKEISGHYIKGDKNNPRKWHYMRFIYRVWKMEEFYGDRFIVSENNSKDVHIFKEQYLSALENNLLQYSAPDGKGDIKGAKKTKKAKKEESIITENHLEKWFVLNGIKKEFLTRSKGVINTEIVLHDQLPCGIFSGSKASDCHEATRIFNKGAIDLWGINPESKEVCLFELKEKNNYKLGIISELFFYSCVLRDILKIGKGNRKSYNRGFQELWEGNKENQIIRAYFLAPKFHSFIDSNIDRIIEEMNKRKGTDKKVVYGYIMFDQDDITGKENDDKIAFVTALNKEWKEKEF